jgi:hypothetical protein
MTLTEATPAQQVDALDGHPLDSPPAAWLPLTAADVGSARGVERPEHGWPGSLFVFLANLAAFGMGLGALGSGLGIIFFLLMGDWGPAGLAALAFVGLSLGSVLQRTLANHVDHFTRWGWYGAMAELALVTFAKVDAIASDPTNFGGPMIGIVLDLLWMRYFWERRADFDVDLNI